MPEQDLFNDKFYIILYAAVTALEIAVCCYLFLRRGNAFAPGNEPPVRSRRWMAVLFGIMSLSHLMYMPMFFLDAPDDRLLCSLVCSLFDFLTLFPLIAIVLVSMLQDKRRPLWPFFLMPAPAIIFALGYYFSMSPILIILLRLWFVVMSVGLLIYLVRALRQYRRWLRDNYADLEHKEVGQIFLVMTIFLLPLDLYMSYYEGTINEYILQFIGLLFIFYLPWRVETLSDLSPSKLQAETGPVATEEEEMEGDTISPDLNDRIGHLLQQHCIDTQLYLQHDLTLNQLARALRINRLYLSQYFSSQNTNYNVYINNLRINYFVTLYREAVANHSQFTIQQLAYASGYHSYSTFTLAFKQRMGKNVTTWMRSAEK